ncbi:class I SAM-dependent methyltransferase [Nitriliruptor alkaliphilus]|uniref:class I SAM-dependent methyltransferase n=1 Tax=Nitriliruptor alkaliphilus TaxID=427918 RepID=UPI000698ADC5|nr:class I SAM-dependent methyltransferase [Nitriliruptor alkaliphilus]
MSTLPTWLTAFVEANRRRSKRLERRLPHTRPRLHVRYARTVARYADKRPDRVVVDLGAGRASHFVALQDPRSTAEIVGVDVDGGELALNEEVDSRVVVAPGAPLPFADASVDLVVSRSVLEHIAGVEATLAEAHRILVPGGRTIHVFASKRAPFSLLNRVLPGRASSWLLRNLVPGSDGRLGFPAHYEHCTASQMEQVLRRQGFEVERTEVSYYQSDYFGFLLPLYALSVVYERIVRAFGRRDLAATVLIVARKPKVRTTPGR